jgi:hypothetical protein
VADELSRKDEDVESLLYTIWILQPEWIIEVRDEWKNDEEVWTLIHKLEQDPTASDTLGRKMIFCGTRIAYIYVRTPNSNKRFFWNCTPLL